MLCARLVQLPVYVADSVLLAVQVRGRDTPCYIDLGIDEGHHYESTRQGKEQTEDGDGAGRDGRDHRPSFQGW